MLPEPFPTSSGSSTITKILWIGCLSESFSCKGKFQPHAKMLPKLSDSLRFLCLEKQFCCTTVRNYLKPQHLCRDVFLGKCLVLPQAAFAQHWWQTRALQEGNAKTKESGRSKGGADWILSLLVKDLLLEQLISTALKGNRTLCNLSIKIAAPREYFTPIIISGPKGRG